MIVPDFEVWIDRVALEPVTVDGVRVAVEPAGSPLTLRVIGKVKYLRLIGIATVATPPCFTVAVAGEWASVKSGR